METAWEGRIVGTFEGYARGRVFELSEGRRWRQESNTGEHVYRERPEARLIRDQSTGTRFLDLEGTSGVVIVVPERGMGGLSAGAF